MGGRLRGARRHDHGGDGCEERDEDGDTSSARGITALTVSGTRRRRRAGRGVRSRHDRIGNARSTSGTGEVLGADAGNTTEKDPQDWVTGDEPMTGAQKSYLDTLARDAGETLSADLTKAEASAEIEQVLQWC